MYSTDGGASFADASGPSSEDWFGVAACGDTGTFYAVAHLGGIWKSTDKGASFTEIDSTDRYNTGLDCSADATKVVLVSSTTSYPLMSTDSGASFSEVTSVGTGQWADACIDD